MSKDVSRRDAMKTALKAGAYAAPVVLAATVPAAVGASPPPTVTFLVTNVATPAGGVVPTATTFTVTIRNTSAIAASAITVSDVPSLAASVYLGSSATMGTYDPAAGVWSIPLLAAGAVATLLIDVLALLAGPQTNTATLTASTPAAAPSPNNTATATFTGVISSPIG